jgi:thiosulfate dehydrogenase
LPSNKAEADAIKLGYNIIVNTPQYAPQYVSSGMSCSNCHLNAGQRDKAFPLVGIAAVFPEYSSRDQRLISLEDRIRGCFARSQNGQAPPYESQELLAVAAYITWISAGQPVDQNPPWRHQNVIPTEHQLPVSQLDKAKGQQLYQQQCVACHGSDGQGVQLTPTLKPGPLWGAKSYNDGAGLASVQSLAGFIRYAMPYNNPSSLSDEAAQEIAAYVDSQPRPHF